MRRYAKDGKVGDATLAPTRASVATTASSVADMSITENTDMKGSRNSHYVVF